MGQTGGALDELGCVHEGPSCVSDVGARVHEGDRNMFRHLVSVGDQRTPGQAVGFYLFYLVAGIILIWALGRVETLVASPSQSQTIERPAKGSTVVSFGRGTSVVTAADGTTEVTAGGTT